MTVVTLSGWVEVKLNLAGKWEPARVGMTLAEGALISTGFNSQAAVADDACIVVIPALSRAELVLLDPGAETEQLTVIQDGPDFKPLALIPPPPVGFGKNERIKIQPPQNSALKAAREAARPFYENAGFDSQAVLPKTVPVIIDIIWP